MLARDAITVICVPHCGHASTVRNLLRRRRLPFVEHALTLDGASEVSATYHVYGSPVLVLNGEAIVGMPAIMNRIQSLVAAR